MQILNTLSKKELAQTILAEVAKTKNEIKCAENDLKKANSRLSFLIVLANELIQRTDKKENRYADRETRRKTSIN